MTDSSAPEGQDSQTTTQDRDVPELLNTEALEKTLYRRAYQALRRRIGARAASLFGSVIVLILVFHFLLEALNVLPELRKNLEFVPGVLSASGYISELLHPRCGLTTEQCQNVSNVGEAAQQVGEFAANEFPTLRNEFIAINKIDAAIDGTREHNDLAKPLTVEAIAVRVSAAKWLTSYGALLEALVTKTQASELANASNDFISSTGSIPGERMTNDQLDPVMALALLGDSLIKYRKAQAIKLLVPLAADDVNRLCDLLSNDFNPMKSNVAAAEFLAIMRLRVDADYALRAKATPFAERVAALDGVILANESNARLELADAQAAKAVETLKKANQQLVLDLKNEPYSLHDVKTLGTQLKDLAANVRTLGSFSR